MVEIRKAADSDLGAIHALVCELAEYEHGLHRVTTTPESYLKDFQAKIFDAFVAEVDGEIVGMVLFYMNFSTWRGRMMYLEDFIVKESMRGHGIGKQLFDAFLEEAKRQECTMVKWQVAWPAITLKYDTVDDSVNSTLFSSYDVEAERDPANKRIVGDGKVISDRAKALNTAMKGR
jgi:N-acetylglutamate synthase-like GNAT family acetyltransferase